MKKKYFIYLGKALVFLSLALLLYNASLEFFQVAWGTGIWAGQFSFKWGGLFFILVSFNVFLLTIAFYILWMPQRAARVMISLEGVLRKIRPLRWLLIPIMLVFPAWLLQYSLWGIAFSGPYLRILMWGITLLALGTLLTSEENLPMSWSALITGALLSSAGLVLTSAFSNVTDYPFNLYWSDGNRIWDYSIMFGRHLYNYPSELPIDAYISSGRQFLWGIPFLLPTINIFATRFWSALISTLPYAILGWIVFRKTENTRRLWPLVGLGAFLFLNQGPIYTPLVLSAILVAIAWERPLWLAAPLVGIAGYYAQASRWTWLVAPAMWIGMLELSDISMQQGWLPFKKWKRVFLLVASGIIGGVLIPGGINLATKTKDTLLVTKTFEQPLLWYRLFPSDTYGLGILLGISIATLPLLFLLLKQKWSLSLWQKLGIIAPLLAFFIVGLIASLKIGGGNNLHNLDMFLIALVFVAAIAWKANNNLAPNTVLQMSASLKFSLLALVIIPAIPHLLSLRPRIKATQDNIIQVEILTDYVPYVSAPLPLLPSDAQIESAMQIINEQVQRAVTKGDILFMDQRQLLTFGYVPRIPLVPEYEKKMMMDKALSGDAEYFRSYYRDLSEARFSLIVTEPLKIAYKGEREGVFGEESDAWTKWIAEPTLCFYEPIVTLKDVYIQMLVPREDVSACSIYLR